MTDDDLSEIARKHRLPHNAWTGQQYEIDRVLSALREAYEAGDARAELRLLQMQYVGACALLGRVARKLDENDEDRHCIKQALDDCIAALPGRFELWKTGNGWSLEPRRNVR